MGIHFLPGLTFSIPWALLTGGPLPILEPVIIRPDLSLRKPWTIKTYNKEQVSPLARYKRPFQVKNQDANVLNRSGYSWVVVSNQFKIDAQGIESLDILIVFE